MMLLEYLQAMYAYAKQRMLQSEQGSFEHRYWKEAYDFYFYAILEQSLK